MHHAPGRAKGGSRRGRERRAFITVTTRRLGHLRAGGAPPRPATHTFTCGSRATGRAVQGVLHPTPEPKINCLPALPRGRGGIACSTRRVKWASHARARRSTTKSSRHPPLPRLHGRAAARRHLLRLRRRRQRRGGGTLSAACVLSTLRSLCRSVLWNWAARGEEATAARPGVGAPESVSRDVGAAPAAPAAPKGTHATAGLQRPLGLARPAGCRQASRSPQPCAPRGPPAPGGALRPGGRLQGGCTRLPTPGHRGGGAVRHAARSRGYAAMRPPTS